MTTIDIPVKPYIKKYLETNYGNPVNFSGIRGINDFFSLLLDKQRFERDKQTTLDLYTGKVSIVISRDKFFRNGWCMSKTSIVSFNGFFEYIIKTRLRDIVNANISESDKKISESIRQFQDDFNLSEDIFSYDSIIKDLQRYTNINKSNKAEKKVCAKCPLKCAKCP